MALFCLFIAIFDPFICSAQLLAPVVLLGPLSQTVSEGGNVTFNVTVVSLESVTYQWYFGTTAIPSATGSSYTISKATLKNAGGYYVNCVNGIGSTPSGTAYLTVNVTPPVANNDSYYVIENVLRTVSAPGVMSNDSNGTGSDVTAMLVTNVSHGTLTLNANGGFTYLPATHFYGTDSFSYRDIDSSTNSNVATVTLTVLAPPAITNQPQSQWVPSNSVANFSVGVSGSIPMRYQWWFQGALMAGATNSTLTISNVQGQNIGSYSVVATNTAGSATSAVAVLSIYQPPSAATLAATNVTARSARLNAVVNPQGTVTSYYFKYGATTNYGSFTATNNLPAGTNTAPVGVPITSLEAGSVYYYSVIAVNPGGTSIGANTPFSTLSIPSIQFSGSMIDQGSTGQQYMQLALTNVPGAAFTVFGSSNLLPPSANWTVLGSMTEIASGQYQFTDPQPATNSAFYYRIQSQ